MRSNAHCERVVDDIRKEWDRVSNATSQSLIQRMDSLKSRVRSGEKPTSLAIAVPAYALAAEAVRRATGKSLHDVQLLGGLVLAVGAIAEIQTGEGKTIVAALPAALHSLAGKGVHVATTNDYLSERDYHELKPAYEALGLSVGLIRPRDSQSNKLQAYRSDITYGPGYEFGFDFLRDQLALRSQFTEPLGARHLQQLRGQHLAEQRLTQPGHAFAIIDEADSVLIDEATTPLILSGAGDSSQTGSELYGFAREVAQQLDRERDFGMDAPGRSVYLTDKGHATIYRRFKDRPRGQLARPWCQLVEQALRAEHLLDCGEQYVVREDQVVIVDQNTGRLHEDRRWRAGLHQAVEVKEGLAPSAESHTQARVTRQRYTRLYDAVCGLTGTARGAQTEFGEFYNLPVLSIPTHRPCIRTELATRWFGTKKSKYASLAADVVRRSQRGQPVLIGTRTIQDSRMVSDQLHRLGARHALLNGLQDADEAEIVSRAGNAGTISVATNMAGRGTDIRLDHTAQVSGGLHVAAAEFQESRRVDRQLVGRAARQGDPGSAQFWASPEDRVFADHAPSLCHQMRRATESASGELQRDFEPERQRLQQVLEAKDLDARRQMVAHDNWLETVQSALAKKA